MHHYASRRVSFLLSVTSSSRHGDFLRYNVAKYCRARPIKANEAASHTKRVAACYTSPHYYNEKDLVAHLFLVPLHYSFHFKLYSSLLLSKKKSVWDYLLSIEYHLSFISSSQRRLKIKCCIWDTFIYNTLHICLQSIQIIPPQLLTLTLHTFNRSIDLYFYGPSAPCTHLNGSYLLPYPPLTYISSDVRLFHAQFSSVPCLNVSNNFSS